MKFKKGLFKSAVALVMALALSVSVFAATHYASTSKDIEDAFANDADEEVRIIMQGDIALANKLEAKTGQKYIIEGKEYVLSDVALIGDGVVNINAEVSSTEGNKALDVGGDVDVTVNGDINADSVGSTAIAAKDNANVTVNGNVTADSSAVEADGSANVNVNGDVNGEYGIITSQESTVGVVGDVEGGIIASGDSEVEVTGDVSANDGVLGENNETANGGIGVSTNGNAKVAVDGNVKGGDGAATEKALEESGSYADGGAGVWAYGNSEVSVTGDVIGGNSKGTYGFGGTGVVAEEKSTVEVGGNVKGGDVIGNPDVKSTNGNTANDSCGAGAGVYKDYEATVTVDGDVEGGSVNTDQGRGGYGAVIIILTPENEGHKPQLLENDAEDEQEEETPVAGKLTVSGTIKGGKANNSTATPGDGVHYCVNDAILDLDVTEDMLDENFDMTIENHLDSLYSMIRYVLAYSPEANDMFNTLEGNYKELYSEIFTYLGIDDESVDLNSALANASEEQIAYVKALIISKLNEFDSFVVSGLYSKLSTPETTVWKISDENGGELVSSDFGDEIAELLLADNTEYIIRTESNENGTISVDKKTAMEGETVTVTVTPHDGYKLKAVYVSGTELKAENGVYSFVVNAGGGYTVSAEFEKIATEGENKDNEKSTGVKTGDESFTALYAVLAVLGLGGSTVAILKKQKGSAK